MHIYILTLVAVLLMRAWLRFLYYVCVCQKKAQAQIFVTKTGFHVLGIGDTASHFLAIINIACSNAVRPGIFFYNLAH